MPRSSTRTLYLHIGAHRTGTTSIQRFLRANHVELVGRGFLYPYGVPRHFEAMGRLFNGSVSPADLAADLEHRAANKPHPIHSIVMSDEDVCTRRDLSPLARLAKEIDLKVVFCLRRQDLWLESWYRQNVKWQWNRDLAHLTFDAFLERRKDFFWIDYAAMVRRLQNLLGPDAVRLLVFDPADMPDGPVTAFARLIGLDDMEGFKPAQKFNSSVSPLSTEYVRTLPLDEIPERYRRFVEQAVTKMDWYVKQRYGSQSSYFMAPETREAVLAEYAAGNANLARRAFGRKTLFAEPLPPADAPLAPQTLPDDPYAIAETFTANFVRALATFSIDAIDAARAAGEEAGRRAADSENAIEAD